MTSLGLESSRLTWLEWHDHISIIRKEMHVQILPLKPAPQIEYTQPSENAKLHIWILGTPKKAYVVTVNFQNCIFETLCFPKMHIG